MNELALFAGAGGGILGGKLLGWRTVCAVENNGYARDVLLARQNDGCLPPFPIWDDVRTFDGVPWRGCIDVVSGGFPCQDISTAGGGAGITGTQSGLWSEMARIVGEVRSRFVFVENSPALTARGLGRVLGDLADMGYDARWGVLGAHQAGAPHQRNRIWIRAEMADDSGDGRHAAGLRERKEAKQSIARSDGENVPDAHGKRCEKLRREIAVEEEHEAAQCGDWWRIEPNVVRVAHGVAARVDRLRCLGNGQVPSVAALAWRILSDEN